MIAAIFDQLARDHIGRVAIGGRLLPAAIGKNGGTDLIAEALLPHQLFGKINRGSDQNQPLDTTRVLAGERQQQGEPPAHGGADQYGFARATSIENGKRLLQPVGNTGIFKITL